MDKEKLLKAGMWLSTTVLIIAIDANLLMAGFNLEKRDGDNTVLIIAVCLLPVLFFCAYKGIKFLLDAIFS
ncbi:MAG: hypothetical protein ISR02_03390 [Flavobacteriales bacterium]|nr:hypothetical protein [Flavobacteriales bacterium]